MVEQILNNNEILAIILRNSYKNDGIEFFTPEYFSQQLAFMHHKQGNIIQPHFHNIIKKEILDTQEILFIKKGKIKVNFYNKENIFLFSNILETGDIILLVTGGHGFEMLEDTDLIEIKQGPYAGNDDKTRFIPKYYNKDDI